MVTHDDNTKDRLIAAAISLLDEEPDTEKITVRRLAKQAGVGVGVLNYHFGSKDALLNTAVGIMISKMAAEILRSDTAHPTDPIGIIRDLIKRTSTFAAKYPNRAKAMITADLLHGQMQAPTELVPLLRAKFPDADDLQLRLMALQIVLPIQMAGIRPDMFSEYCRIDITDAEQRDRTIDIIIDSAVGTVTKEDSR